MEDKLKALFEDLMSKAFDPGTQKYNFRETNEIIREHFEKINIEND